MLDIEMFAFLGRCCRRACICIRALLHFLFLSSQDAYYSELLSHLIWDLQIHALLVETNLFRKFSIILPFHIEYQSVLSRCFFFSLKVTNFYRKSFGDDLLPMVTHGTNGNQWLPSATVGCHRSPSVGITFYRWLPMGELRTHPMCWRPMWPFDLYLKPEFSSTRNMTSIHSLIHVVLDRWLADLVVIAVALYSGSFEYKLPLLLNFKELKKTLPLLICKKYFHSGYMVW